MDFFEQQEHARLLSRRLVGLYLLAVLAVVLSVHAAAAAILVLGGERGAPAFPERLLDPRIFACTAGCAVLLVLAGTLVKIATLRGGGAKVAASLGGREVAPGTRDFRERRLLNVVEEMALAAGVRIPRVFVLDGEEGLNAFAAGHTADDAAVAVTAGLLQTLNREELQAVIGHEFSHLLNGDMRLNLRLIAGLGGILALAVTGRLVMELAGRSLRYSAPRRSSRKNQGGGGFALALLLGGLALWIIGSIGVFFARMIQSAVSRQREYLADASAVQFTRNPESLAQALTLIGASSQGGALHHGRAAEVSHMLFASGGRRLFATHPDLVERIRRIAPSFDGDFQPARLVLRRRTDERRNADAEDDAPDLPEELPWLLAGAAHRLVRSEEQPPAAAPSPTPPPLPSPAPLAWMGSEERAALRDASSAAGCLYAAVLSQDPAVRATQQKMLPSDPSDAGASTAATTYWERRLRNWTPRQRRMASELAVERLRAEPPAVRDAIGRHIDTLSRADGTLDSFEFALARLIHRRFQPPLPAARKAPLPPTALAEEIALVFRALALFGERPPEEARSAWDAAVARFGQLPFPPWDSAQPAPTLDALEAALERLGRLPPLHKRELLGACEALVRQDGRLTDAEADFLHAIADAIDAPGWRIPSAASGAPT